MKQKHFLRFPLFALGVILILFSCTKQGPTGATGPQGPQGPAGSPGVAGPKGDTGTANVMYSDWFTPDTYTKDTVFGTYHFYYDKPDSAITQEILDSGIVLTYGKLDGYTSLIWPTNQVSLMPITLVYRIGATIYTDSWSALATVGNLRIQFTNDKNYYNSVSPDHQFRYIIIPGGVKAFSIPKDYKTLCQQYKIPEN